MPNGPNTGVSEKKDNSVAGQKDKNVHPTVDIRVTEDHGSSDGLRRDRGGEEKAADVVRPCGGTTGHMPMRSSSDIGLPATSMPNLALQLGVSVEGGSENHLGVYCSPRTSRRSVDLDLKPGEDERGGRYEWLETVDSSNSLKVLSASSRVGSALSLNSECTARSIGLLSNDSDSDNDTSLSEREKLSDKPAQLRRFMSHPEEGTSPEVSARPSQSLCNLKSANVSQSVDAESGSRADTLDSSVDINTLSSFDEHIPSDSTDKGNELPKTLSGNENRRGSVPSKKTSQQLPGIVSAHRRNKHDSGTGTSKAKDTVFTISDDNSSTGASSGRSRHVVCYKCDTHDTSRDGRIRQWLQDMDNHTTFSNG